MQLEGRNVLVTGGVGLVGSVLCKHLVERCQASVTILDDLSTGDIKNVSDIEVNFVEGSVTDKGLTEGLVKKNDIIFHLAARNIIAASKNPEKDYEVNIGGTLSLLLQCKEHGIERFIYASTSSVYGNPRYLPINEDDGKNFLNLYSVSKYAGENYSKVFYDMYRIPVTVVRYSNVYGGEIPNPGDPYYSGAVELLIYNALLGNDLLIYGDGEQTRDFTYVDDAVEATILAATIPQAIGQIYNIGTGREITINQLAEKVIRLCNSNSTVRYIDRRDIDNIRRRVLNIEKIRHELGWVPRITLEEGLKRTIGWIRRRI